MAKRIRIVASPTPPRIVIENVTPEIDGGNFPVKRIVGEQVVVRANVFADGHDEVKADLLFRAADETDWREVPMKALGNDAWIGSFVIEKENMGHCYWKCSDAVFPVLM